MSQQLTQSEFVTLMSVKLQQVVDYICRFPVVGWRGLVLFLAAAWMVHSAASLFWTLIPTPEIAQPQKLALPPSSGGRASGSTQSVSLDSLTFLKGVFGKAGKTTVVSAPKATPVPPGEGDFKATRLSLKLHGVFASSDPQKGSAIIADGSKQILYSVGDEMESKRGVKLASVLEKRVILDNKGSMESLWLFSEEDFVKRKNVRQSKPAKKPRKSNNIRTSARPDQIPKNIGDVVRFSVHREGGKMVGYRIRPGRDRQLFTQVGLKANDIVTSVNGIEVNDPKQIRSVYKSMKTATEAQLTVLRDGDTHSITISLDSGG